MGMTARSMATQLRFQSERDLDAMMVVLPDGRLVSGVAMRTGRLETVGGELRFVEDPSGDSQGLVLTARGPDEDETIPA